MTSDTIHRVVRILRARTRNWITPYVAIIANQSRDPFKVLISCILSLRTQDRTTAAASERLFGLATTPAAMVRLSEAEIERAIYPVGFYRTKAATIRAICADLLDRFDGRVPSELDTLLTLKGVGRKTANLVVSVGYGKPAICVDTHVHRIMNRLGYVRTRTPEATERRLRAKLPRRYWIEINDLLVCYGQNLCKPVSPLCSHCDLARFCRRVGVRVSR